ncbi:MAG: GNAT family N-acetyltransferase [Thermomicrobiales bacterium]
MVNAERSALPVEIRPADASQLDLLEEQFSPHSRSRYHYRRFAAQQHGDGIYLIAWHGTEPVGHFLLRWHGPTNDPTGRYPHDTSCLEAGATLPAFQRRGVGTRMIGEAERIARAKGYRRIGLAVGSTDNPLAQRLYERLGYRDWGNGTFTISWEYETKDGRKGTESEVCIYMFKDL